MIIRKSFVSNSSSTSFCITKCCKFEELTDMKNSYVPYQIDDCLEINIYCKYKDLAYLYEIFKGEEYKERHDRWYDYVDNVYRKPDMEEEDSIWGISLSSLFDKNKEVYEKITRITFSSDECETLGLYVLSLLYKFFELKGFEPDSSNSEKSLEDDGNFLVNLMTSVLKLSKDKQNE